MNGSSQFRNLVITAAFVLRLTGIANAQHLPGSVQFNPALLLSFCPTTITQNFPTTGSAETTWMICWREVAGNNSIANPNGLVIGPVYFRKSPNAPFVRVLWDMRVSDYFIPYHPGSPRYYDLSLFNFVLANVSAADCPTTIGGAPISAHVCKEVRDRGVMWKDSGGVRRGVGRDRCRQLSLHPGV